MTTVSQEVINIVAKTLQETYGFATVSQLDKAVADLLKQTQIRGAHGAPVFSLSTMVRGMRLMNGLAAVAAPPGTADSREADIAYVKALTTGTTPGSYLVPTIQANEIVQFLSLGGAARAAGVRIWSMDRQQKLNVPIALAAPRFVWMAQNSAQTATDPNLSAMSFDLKERRALVAIPNQLLAVSVPAFDTLLAQLLALAAAEHEDTAFFATSTVSGGPTALYAASGTTVINTGGSANGGSIAYSDLTAVLKASATAKAKGPFVWFMSPRTFYTRLLGLVDTQSRPLAIPTAFQGLSNGIAAEAGRIGVFPQFTLFGWPVFVTPAIQEDESNGSGTNQSHVIFMNPSYAHIAQDLGVEIQISTERFFDANQTAVRAVQHEDFGYAPAAGIVVLKGVN
jgi:HK97 family phage major capsid protein